MAESRSGVDHSSAPTVPPPSSLCPVCQAVEVDARQYRNGSRDLVIYVCDNRHEWAAIWGQL